MTLIIEVSKKQISYECIILGASQTDKKGCVKSMIFYSSVNVLYYNVCLLKHTVALWVKRVAVQKPSSHMVEKLWIPVDTIHLVHMVKLFHHANQ